MKINTEVQIYKRAGKRVRPFSITRKIQIEGRALDIVPIATEMDGSRVVTTYAQKQIKPSAKAGERFHTAKSKRILEALIAAQEPVYGAELSRIGSGKENGWVASLSKEISRLRSLGHNVVKVVDKWVDGQRQCAYQLNPPSIE